MSDTKQLSYSMPYRLLVLIYGAFCYLIFLGTFLYAVGFLGDFVVPKTLDTGPSVPLHQAIFINLILLALFVVQHSVMARPWFKRNWTKVVPVAAERSTYVLLASVILILLFWFWAPIPGTVWSVEMALGQWLLWAVFAAGWLLILYSTFLISHFDLFGLRQVWLFYRNEPYKHLRFVTPGPYRLIRHPLYLGWLMVFWGVPEMSVGHLLFSLMVSAYTLVGIYYEERDLVAHHGVDYENYQASTPMLIPGLKPHSKGGAAAH